MVCGGVCGSQLSASLNFRFSNGGTMQSTFVSAGAPADRQPWFQIFYKGGCLELYQYDALFTAFFTAFPSTLHCLSLPFP